MLKTLLESNPQAEVTVDLSVEVAQSVAYLGSDAALASLSRDPYWPKWDSPWWHMLALHEMGLTDEIPQTAVGAMIAALGRLRCKVFPLHPQDMGPGWSLAWDSSCHCAIGSIYGVLAARGVEVDRELPWMRPWLAAYQMADGGKSCDPGAYRVEGESPSSMVALIAPFEALLYHARDWSDEEIRFLDRAADFLVERQLHLGSSSSHNAAERETASRWPRPCFPRFYLYDTLRGARALLAWSQKRRKRVPPAALTFVLQDLATRFPDGIVCCQRQCYEGVATRLPPPPGGEWRRLPAAPTFPLLQALSRPDRPSPSLTRHWSQVKALASERLFDPVRLVPPNAEWPRLAREEGERFAALLGGNLVRVHHIGSTSIPGLWAKPILDLAPEVHSLESLDGLSDVLQAHGYEYWGEYGLAGRRFCPRVDERGKRLANIHCYQSGAPELFRHLAFRDYLRAHPQLVAEYQAEKLRARDLHPLDGFAYNDEKDAWIRKTEAVALEWADSRR